MTRTYKTIHNVAPQFFIFRSNGTVVLNTPNKEIVGTWEHTNPYAKYGRGYVKSYWRGRLYFKGVGGAYTREELKQQFCQLVKTRGIQIIVSITE